jgi:hypothetical protein
MEVIKMKKITNSEGNLALNIPTEWKDCNVEVVVVIINEESSPKKPELEKYFGKLKWQGDALALQRELRDEWP